ncbi:MAG: hypothetical protein ACD_39C02101G0003 [uncultured bacterium]|nr:MAG: hypothetical protein ACD_39C02101G0003 [uncultured bacterium]
MKLANNIAHSVFQRLLNLSKERREDFNLLLSRYGVERFLYRLGISSYADSFILKGASLFLVWTGQNYRSKHKSAYGTACMLFSQSNADSFILKGASFLFPMLF